MWIEVGKNEMGKTMDCYEGAEKWDLVLYILRWKLPGKLRQNPELPPLLTWETALAFLPPRPMIHAIVTAEYRPLCP
jgi:hypothetical protein